MARGRQGKTGLTRLDAALDHLHGFMGFEKAAIKKKIKELLKEYGGDDGWVFLEEASYKLVIEQLLDQDGSETKSPLLADAASEENMLGDAASSSAVGTSNVLANPVADMVPDGDKSLAEGVSHQDSALTSMDEVSFTQQNVTDNEYDVFPPAEEQTPPEVRRAPPRQQKVNGAPTSPTPPPPPPPEVEYVPPPPPPPPPPEMVPSLPRARRPPCYGWWGEETEVIRLPEMPMRRVKGVR